MFEKCPSFKLVGFQNSDWDRSPDDMLSTSSHCFSLGSGIFSWSSKNVAESTAEAEFIQAIGGVNQVLERSCMIYKRRKVLSFFSRTRKLLQSQKVRCFTRRRIISTSSSISSEK